MGGVKIYYIFVLLSMWPLVVVFINLIFIKMKFYFKVLVLLTLMVFTQERADAYLVHGAASIIGMEILGHQHLEQCIVQVI